MMSFTQISDKNPFNPTKKELEDLIKVLKASKFKLQQFVIHKDKK